LPSHHLCFSPAPIPCSFLLLAVLCVRFLRESHVVIYLVRFRAAPHVRPFCIFSLLACLL
jgi:hypothetical protein